MPFPNSRRLLSWGSFWRNGSHNRSSHVAVPGRTATPRALEDSCRGSHVEEPQPDSVRLQNPATAHNFLRSPLQDDHFEIKLRNANPEADDVAAFAVSYPSGTDGSF
jgi:hypothetical protein